VVEDPGPAGTAGEPSALLRRYASDLAAMPDAIPYLVEDEREAFVRARRSLERLRPGAPDTLATPEGWFKAFVAARTPQADLEQALAGLAEASAQLLGTYRTLLGQHGVWLSARADATIPLALLRLMVLEFQPGPTPPPIGDPRELCLAALAARRRHPGLVALAPTLFWRLLTPHYKAPELPQARAAPTQRHAAPVRRRARAPHGTIPAWAWIVITLFAFATLGWCRGHNPSSPSLGEGETQRLLDDIEHRSKSRRRRRREERRRNEREAVRRMLERELDDK